MYEIVLYVYLTAMIYLL